MKSRLLILLSVVLLVALLVAINAASYVRVEQEAETEQMPDRSTENAGGTGTRALFEYLSRRGDAVSRWRRPMAELAGPDAPQTLVMVGPHRLGVEQAEAVHVLRWAAAGGRLVLVDRSPNPLLLPPAGGWRVHAETVEVPGPDALPDDAEGMTRDTPLVSPAQPTALTRHVSRVTRSRFAARLYAYRADAGAAVAVADDDNEEDLWGGVPSEEEPPPPPAPPATPDGAGDAADEAADEAGDAAGDEGAPVVHVNDGRGGAGALLVDYAYGRGRVVVLSDPYVISNAGINRSDNLFLAVGVVTGGLKGRVAFDEFHHGYGEARNHLFAYFRGTPVLWLFAQGALLALMVVWTRGRRFARPVPEPRPDRRSKLEFVSSMAELQQRARAYDLAVENVYQRTRRALARYGGLPATAPLAQIAERAAARSGRDRARLEALLRECEDAAAGAPLTARRALGLARALRELERDLGILMRSRELRQAR
ncbi:MAG TPA: DUF4350 domain-containing protein [Pyrinomonadaceae bacterium]|jgi:hypothetical protein